MCLRTLACALVILSCACHSGSDARTRQVTKAATAKTSPPPRVTKREGARRERGRSYPESLARLDAVIESRTLRTERMAGQWLPLAELAGTHLARAKMTGDYASYAKTEELLARAFELAPRGAGPFMERASLNFALHRLGAVEGDLRHEERRILVDDLTRTGILAFRGDLAFYTGRYDDAREAYEKVVEAEPSSASLYSLAQYFWKTGDFARAERLLADAERHVLRKSYQEHAWFQLQRGLMDLDRGRYEDALSHYRAADAFFSGWWLVEEHIAEVTALLGRRDEAITMYRSLVARTQNPEFMDALADLVASTNADEARVLRDRSTEIYEERMRQFPEATYGHALEHFLESEDASRALELAKANHRLRPNGESKTLLARAYLKANELRQARSLVEATLRSPYRSSDLHATAARVYAALGDETHEAEQRASALAINPHAFD